MTLKELLAAAKAAVEAGDLEKAKALTEQAKALKAITDLEPVDAPVQRLPFASGGQAETSGTEDLAIKAWYVKKYGEPHAAMTQVAKEIYAGQDYTALTWAKNVDFRRYLRTGYGDPKLSRVILISPAQIMQAVEAGISVAEMKTTMIEGQDTLGGYARAA